MMDSWLNKKVCGERWNVEDADYLGGEAMAKCFMTFVMALASVSSILYIIYYIGTKICLIPIADCLEGDGACMNVIHDLAYDFAKTAYITGNAKRCMKLIKKHNIAINKPLPGSGVTIFLCACMSGDSKLVNYMLKCGADLCKKTLDGDGPFYLASYGYLCSPCPDIKVLKALLRCGSNINEQNKTGFTALHQAAARGCLTLVKFLLKNEANPCLKNCADVYPIQLAESEGFTEVANFLSCCMPAEYHQPPCC